MLRVVRGRGGQNDGQRDDRIPVMRSTALPTVPKMLFNGTVETAGLRFSMARSNLRLVAPASENGTVDNAPPRRKPNAELRSREYLTEAEVERLLKAAGNNRHGQRDAAMLLLAYRHGLRSAELVALKWDQVDLHHGKLHVNRVKSGSPAVHLLSGVELRALRKLLRDNAQAHYVFISERGAPFTTAGFRKMVARLGVDAGFAFGVHPHMLRHACGYKLANQGTDTRTLQAYLGHKNIAHTVRYTERSAARFKGLWKD
jgi:integrase